MNQVVVHAQLVDRLGLAHKQWTTVSEQRDRNGYQKLEHRSLCAQLRPDRFRVHQPHSTLTLGHGGPVVGELVALDRAHDGIWGTWLSDTIRLLGLPRCFISGEFRWQGGNIDADEIEIAGAALVAETASSGTRPATVLAGRLDRPHERDRWRLPAPMRDRLEHAATELRARSRGSSELRVRGLYTPDELEDQQVAAILEHHYRHNPQDRPPDPRPGQIRHASGAHRGKVLRVS